MLACLFPCFCRVPPVITKATCRQEGCKYKASYGLPADGLVTHCKRHCLTTMTHLGADMCATCRAQAPASFTQGVFGYDGNRTRYCAAHRTGHMIDFRRSKRCKLCRFRRAYFGTRDATHCQKCRTDDMKEQPGSRCACGAFVTGSGYRGYCFRCFAARYPDEPRSLWYRKKESECIDFICDPQFATEHKFIRSGKPPFMVVKPTHIVVVEIDEYQNENSPDYIKMSPAVLIRFNPDGYVSDTGTISSPWRRGELKPGRDVEWRERLIALAEAVDHWCEKIPTEPMIIVSLYGV